jgi:Zn-finger nucleic acid-binding protein
MATITVQCPTCDCELELDAQYKGQEVECGSCHQVFVAKSRADRKSARPAVPEREERPEPRGRRRSRRYADEDDDYDDDFYDRRRRRETDGTGLGDASLIIGILSVLVFWCPIIGIPLTIVGLILGCLGLRATRNGTAIAGVVLCGIFLMASFAFLFFWGGFR